MYIEKSFDTIFNMGYGLGNPPISEGFRGDKYFIFDFRVKMEAGQILVAHGTSLEI